MLGTTPPTLRSEAFDNTNNCPIYVLGRSLETYKTATNWVVYAPRMDILAKLDWTFTVDENVVNITKYIGEEKQSIIVPPAEDFLGTTIVFKAGSYEEYCFKDVATTMNSITFNDDVTRLEAWIFRACKFLGVINLPRNLEYFTPVAFWDCTGILSFSISSENTVFETLNSVLYRKGREFLVMYPANRNTTAFSTLAETTSIGGYAFLYAQKLERIQFPNIRVFNYGSIYYCPNLEIVNFGANTTTIAGETISNSPKMKYISCDNPIPPSLASQCFEYTNGCVIRVPVGSVQDYKTATNWSSFNSRILAVANCVIRHNGTPVYDLRYDGTECKQCLLDGNLVYRNKLIFEGEDFFEGTDDGAEYYKTYPLKQSGASVKVYYKKSPTGDLLNVTLLPNETKEVTTWFERGKIEIKNLKYDQLFVYCANGWGTSRNLYIMKIEQAEE